MEEQYFTAPRESGQLFALGSGEAEKPLLFLVTVGQPTVFADQEPSSGLTAVTIRGTQGVAGPGKEPDQIWISWNEAGLDLSAVSLELDHQKLIEAVELLEWQSSDPFDGFLPKGQLSLVAEDGVT